jgi:sulfur carrier protein ThiS
MSGTPTWNLPLPVDGQTPWGDDYRSAMTTIDARLGGMRGSIYAVDESTATVITTQNVGVKATVNTLEGPPCQFCTYPVANRITYIGPLTRVVTVWVAVALTSSNQQTIELAVRKNGQVIPWLTTIVRTGTIGFGNAGIVGHVEIATNDFLELWVTNRTSSANVTIVDLTMAGRG